MILPFFKTEDPILELLQTKWRSILNPILALPLNSSQLLQGVPLINGTTQVNHKLGRKLTGWNIVRQRALASVYDAQDSNQTPDLTLTLVSSAAVTVDLIVF